MSIFDRLRRRSTGTIVFLHVQKTGGTTVSRLLESRLPKAKFAPNDATGRLRTEDPRELRGRIIASHVTAETLRDFGEATVFTVLRDPVERLLSHFYFLKSYTWGNLRQFENETHERIKAMSLGEFLRDAEATRYFRDFYAKRLDPECRSGARMSDPPGPVPDVERAFEFLRRCDVVGVTAELPTFVEAVFARLGLDFDGTLPTLNSRRGLIAEPGFEPVVEETPSAEDRELLAEFTAGDLRIYDYANSLAPRRASS